MLIHLTYISIILILLAFILIPKIAKVIRKNDEDMWEDWTRIDKNLEITKVENYLGKGKIEVLFEKHPFINGDCCRCEECIERYHKELAKDLKEYPDRELTQH